MTAVRALLCSAVLLSCGLIVSAVAGDEKPATQPATAAAVELQPGTWKDITALVAKHQGKIVVVDVWSTSCAPCMQEFPGLVRLQKSYAEQVVCISFNVDYVGIKNKPADFYRPRVEAFLKKQQAQFVNILCTDESDKFFAEQELSSIPAVYVFGKDGKLAKRFDESLLQEGREEAFTYEADIVPFVKQLIGGK
ncbi:MAG: TlpA disulfide reductase family protein [Planctomyces sp.]|jgi:thiol-disulfide isomerase/thioredoxin